MSAHDTHQVRSMRTPLARVRNLGASHSGTTDFWYQRLTAVAMTLLILPVLVIVMMLLGRNQAGAGQILGSLPIAVKLRPIYGVGPVSATANIGDFERAFRP